MAEVAEMVEDDDEAPVAAPVATEAARLTLTDHGGIKMVLLGLLPISGGLYIGQLGLSIQGYFFAAILIIGGLAIITNKRVTVVEPGQNLIRKTRECFWMVLAREEHKLDGYERFDVSLDRSSKRPKYVMRAVMGQKTVPVRVFKKKPAADREARLANGFMSRVLGDTGNTGELPDDFFH